MVETAAGIERSTAQPGKRPGQFNDAFVQTDAVVGRKLGVLSKEALYGAIVERACNKAALPAQVTALV